MTVIHQKEAATSTDVCMFGSIYRALTTECQALEELFITQRT